MTKKKRGSMLKGKTNKKHYTFFDFKLKHPSKYKSKPFKERDFLSYAGVEGENPKIAHVNTSTKFIDIIYDDAGNYPIQAHILDKKWDKLKEQGFTYEATYFWEKGKWVLIN